MYSLYILKDGQKKDITGYAGKLAWGKSIDSLSTQLVFDVVTDNAYINVNIDVGDIVVLEDENIVFKGIITDKTINGDNTFSFSAFDFGFYLNKSKVVKQYTGINASEVIKDICGEFNISVKVPSLSTSIEQVYYNTTVSDIIIDILEQVENETGEKYLFEVLESTLYIWKKGENEISPTYKPATNIAEFNVLDEVGANSTSSQSIVDMRNRIHIVDNNSNIVSSVKDDQNISKYGLLQEVIKISDEDLNKASNIANNNLTKLNKITESSSLQLIGDVKVRCGYILNVINQKLSLNGKYLITSCSHTIYDGVHLMTVVLERI